MNPSSQVEILVQRIEKLERRQRLWTRAVLAVAAVGMLTFVGWAPFDDLDGSLNDLQPATPEVQPNPPKTSDPIAIDPPIKIVEENPSAADLPVAEEGGFQSYTHREGDEPYLPSRMEWISLRASAELPRGGNASDGYGIMYGPDGKGSNTIRILCTYDAKRANREQMEKDLEYAQMQLAGLAKLNGWSWLKVRVESRALN